MRARLAFPVLSALLVLLIASLRLGADGDPSRSSATAVAAASTESPADSRATPARGHAAARSKVETYIRRSDRGRVAARGIVVVTPNEGDAANRPPYRYQLDTAQGRVELDLGNVRVQGAGQRAGLEPGQVLTVKGTSTGTKLAVSQAALAGSSVEYGPHPITADPATQRGPTVRKALVIPVRFKNDSETFPYPPADAMATLNGSGGMSFNDYYRTVSSGYGTGTVPATATAGDLSFDFTLHPTVYMDDVRGAGTYPECSSVPGMAPGQVDLKAGIVRTAPQYAQYDHLMYLFPCWENNYKGRADLRNVQSEFFFYSTGNAPSLRAFVHELGHNLGLGHSNRADCDVADMPAPIAPSCASTSYGAAIDTMGHNALGGDNGTGLLGGYRRVQLGFIPEANAKTVTPTDGQVFSLWNASARMAPNTTQLLRVPRPNAAAAGNPQDAYYLAARVARAPFDAYAANDAALRGIDVVAGTPYDKSKLDVNQIDTNPVATRYTGSPQAYMDLHPSGVTRVGKPYALPVGRSFYDPAEDYTITTRSFAPGPLVAGITPDATVTVEPGPPKTPSTSVAVVNRKLVVTASAGAANNVSIGESGTDYVIADYGNVATAGSSSGCQPAVAGNPQIVKCPKSAISAAIVSLGDGNDQASVKETLPLAATLNGGPGDDTLIGGAGDDVITGGPGQDFLKPGTGTDTASFADMTTPVTWDSSINGRVVNNSAGNDEFASGASFQRIIAGASDDIIRWNSGGTHYLDGGPGRDSLKTAGLDDVIVSRDGVADALIDCAGSTGDQAIVDAADPPSSGCETSTTPFNVVIASGPEAGATTGPQPTFEFRTYTAATGAQEGFRCRIAPEQTTYSPCPSVYTPAALTAGAKTLSVAPSGGGVGASRTFTVDATPPSVSLGTKPAAREKGRYSTFSFSSSEPGGSFECSLDGAIATACQPPKSYVDLAEGTHTFTAKALDASGNRSAATPVHTWTIDRTLPVATITGGPSGSTNAQRPTFTFSSSSTDLARFDCRITPQTGTAVAFSSCSAAMSHQPAAALEDGAYRFEAKAIDQAGNAIIVGRDFTVSTGGLAAVAGSNLSVAAYAGRVNAFTVRQSGTTFTVEDTDKLQAGAGCTQVDPRKVQCISASVAVVSVDAGDGNDSIDADTVVKKSLTGGTGDDTIRGIGVSTDTLRGGDGFDTVSYAGITKAVVATLDDATNDGPVGEALDSIATDVEAVRGGSGADQLAGSTRAARLEGGPGDDVLTAGSGGSTLDGGDGSDTLTGASGVDIADFSARTDALTVSLPGTAVGNATLGTDTLNGAIEKAIGGSGVDWFADGAGDQTFVGGAGADVFTMSGGGVDRVDGGGGNDRIVDGPGNDRYFGDTDNDTFVLGPNGGSDDISGGESIDTVDLTAITAAVALSMEGTRNDGDPAFPAEFDNVAADVESALTGPGNDTIDPARSGGSIDSGAGADTVTFVRGLDPLALSQASSTNKLFAVFDSALGYDTKVLVNVDRVLGTPFADTMQTGLNAATDRPVVLDGLGGDDILTGGFQADTLVGGAGRDSLDGRDGNDRLEAKDGVTPESLQCGAGVDVAVADAGDLPTACETVQ